MKGFFGKIIEIDLNSGETKTETIPDVVYHRGLGGKGLAAYLLLRDNPPGVDPLGPDNRLILATGPGAGSPVWGSCRHGVFTKSPQTGFFSESYAGGTAAEAMSAAGYDAVVISGLSKVPVWIELSDGVVEIHDAQGLWGLDTYRTEDAVKGWIRENRPAAGRPGVLVIGPAGENRVVFSVIENDYWRSAGRTGVGAVMGAKGLKAVAFYGSSKRSFAAPDSLKSFAKALAGRSKEDAGVKAYKTSGTPMLVDIMNEVGGFPTRYWRKGRSGHVDRINAGALHSRCSVKPHACLKCFIACGRLSTVQSGRHKGLTIEGPEYETIYAFGGLCEVDSIEEIAYLNDICDRLGLDTITAGNLAALAIEAVEQGRVEYDVRYGSVDGIARLLQDMTERRGIGRILARGIRAAASEWGMEEQAIHVKGMEPAGYDPRILKGMGLAYATSDRGACHLRATFYKPELSGMVDPDKIEGKAAIFAEWEDRLTILDTLILCRFYRDLYTWEPLSEILKGLTGLDLDIKGMRDVASRVSDDVRRFNLREGLTTADDRIPIRFQREALPETNRTISLKEMNLMLDEYYQVRGWNEDGEPV